MASRCSNSVMGRLSEGLCPQRGQSWCALESGGNADSQSVYFVGANAVGAVLLPYWSWASSGQSCAVASV